MLLSELTASNLVKTDRQTGEDILVKKVHEEKPFAPRMGKHGNRQEAGATKSENLHVLAWFWLMILPVLGGSPPPTA